LDVQLGILGEVGADAENFRGGIRVDVAVTIEVSGGVDLIVPKVCQASGNEVLRCTISVTVENVNPKDSLPLSLSKM
jgi:hypothetical protein